PQMAAHVLNVQEKVTMRPWIMLTCVFAAGLMAVTCLAQTSPAPSSPDKAANGSPSAATSANAAAPTAEQEADTDSADIPAMARGRISEEEYFALRDQQIRM